ncbi:protein involved in cell wall biogenesis and architecture [Scheffersomyces stipitis CBS 6054]|uniref:Protein involved in cell wall biogenesis and architecture n=1 Tax=Scheffersomyces stipitis (strain ATCC 58785 / CBS 6054 / NBRC 10063 / NRRL Y-11545) TaxID=322104 RepID=A3GFU6_PICST|nr:protein involved in cell wall biogenesis and architecture [Scheffersomyces stipitis CBS 6054]EAZ63821.2 protein involved in cell wall biogenesis and architecture [Scheffersomyces stipitis CBS 6054]
MATSYPEEVETAKFPDSPRFFSPNGLPDLKTYQIIRDNKPVQFNGQSANVNYNPYTMPQTKTRASLPLDYYHLPSKITITDLPPEGGIPVFQLDSAQSADPIRFVESVEHVAKSYGAVKIKLPEPEVSIIKNNIQINPDLFWFQTNKLLNNPGTNELTSRLRFHHDLMNFHSSNSSISISTSQDKKRQSVSLHKLPMIDKRPLDLYKLFKSVIIRGGFIEVINKKLWAQIGRELGYRGKIMTSLSSSLKSSYQRILYPYEIFLTQRSVEYFDDLGKAQPVEESEFKKRKIDTPLIVGSAKHFKRSLRSKSQKGFLISSPHLMDPKQPNTFVLKPEEGTKKRNKRAPDIIYSPILPQTQLNYPLKVMLENQAVYEDDSSSKLSSKCASTYSLRQFMEKDLKFQEFIIQHNRTQFSKVSAGTSNSFFHFYDQPNNAPIPDRTIISFEKFEHLYWKYVRNQGVHTILDDGLELENGESLPQSVNGSGFVRIGDDLINYKNSLHSSNVSTPGKTVNSTYTKQLNVLTSTYGVPPEEPQFNSKDYINYVIAAAMHPWNLHNLPFLPNSLLGSLLESDLNNQELTNSRLNIGMTFSTQNWRCEDHFTHLINFQFFGAFRRWFFIPESEFEKFEQLLTKISESDKSRASINNNDWNVDDISSYIGDEENDYDTLTNSLENMINVSRTPRLAHKSPKFQKLIDKKTQSIRLNQDYLITPELLNENGILFTTTIQKPGEMIVKLPKTYSCTISMGFNLSEEVNFATKNWLDYALEAEKWLQSQSILPNFSTFKMLTNLIQLYDSGKNVGFNSEVYERVNSLYDALYQEELELRSQIRKLKIKEINIDEKLFNEIDFLADDDLSSTFPSRIVLVETSSKQRLILSLKGFLNYYNEKSIDINDFTIELHIFYTDEKLKNFSRILNNYSIDYESWLSNYESLMNENSDLTLKTYKSLLNEGERILSAITSANCLTNEVSAHENTQKFSKFMNYIENLRQFISSSNQFIEECQNLLAIKHQQRIRNGNDYQNVSGLNDLISLIDRIPTLNFTCAEVDQILEFKNEIENFDKASRTLLAKKSRSLQEFDDLINLGESFGIEIPSLTFITRVRDRLKWIRVFKLIEKGADPFADKKEVFTLSDLKAFFDEGIKILSEEDASMIEEIEKILAQSEKFDNEITEFLKVEFIENLNLEKLTGIVERFRTQKLFISLDNYNEVSKVHIHSNLITQFQKLQSSSERFTYGDVRQMSNSINEFDLKFNLSIVDSQLSTAENWVNSLWEETKDIRVITTLSKDIDLEHLNTRLTLNTRLIEKLYQLLYKSDFSFSDEDIYENSSSFVTNFAKDDDSANIKFYCICREYEYGTMIECDKCNEWYHLQCVNEEESSNDSEDENYVCPMCKLIESSEVLDDFLKAQLTLERILSIKNEGDQLKVYPSQEMMAIEEIYETVSAHKIKLQKMISDIKEKSDISLELKLDQLRFILRKLFSSGVFIKDVFEEVLSLVRKYTSEVNELARLQSQASIDIPKIENDKQVAVSVSASAGVVETGEGAENLLPEIKESSLSLQADVPRSSIHNANILQRVDFNGNEESIEQIDHAILPEIQKGNINEPKEKAHLEPIATSQEQSISPAITEPKGEIPAIKVEVGTIGLGITTDATIESEIVLCPEQTSVSETPISVATVTQLRPTLEPEQPLLSSKTESVTTEAEKIAIPS